MSELSTDLDNVEKRLEEKEETLRERARQKGRIMAGRVIRKIDPVFTPRRLNPDDAKVLFHPVDFIVFNGMKKTESVKNLILLDQETTSTDHRRLQRSIEQTIAKERYDWVTLRVKEDGGIEEQ